MRNRTKYFILLMVLLTITVVSCEKFSGNNDSIAGLWRCEELSSPRRYSVTISRSDFDTTYFVIYNFHNLGQEIETYVQLKDSTITFLNLNTGNYSFSGKGIAHNNYSIIDWDYSISGSGVNDGYVRAYYYKK